MAAGRIPYLMNESRRSSFRDGSLRHDAGSVASIGSVSAPKAHILPQYSRPQSTVETTVNVASRYHATLYLKIGRSQLTRPKMLTMVINWLFQNPSSTTQATRVTYFSVLLLRKKLTSATTVNPAKTARSTACE